MKINASCFLWGKEVLPSLSPLSVDTRAAQWEKGRVEKDKWKRSCRVVKKKRIVSNAEEEEGGDGVL